MIASTLCFGFLIMVCEEPMSVKAKSDYCEVSRLIRLSRKDVLTPGSAKAVQKANAKYKRLCGKKK